jgi:predicted ABC-type ATPase
MIEHLLDRRSVIVAIAGSNGAGKTTFFHSHLREAGLRFINADDIARELDISAYEAAEIADTLRHELVRQRESFVFETVFSDPAGEKLAFLTDAVAAGYNVVLCFIGISGPETSEERVAMRVSQSGHGVPPEKLITRWRLATLRHSGFAQWRWRPRLRKSERNNSLQCMHLHFALRFIGRPPTLLRRSKKPYPPDHENLMPTT